MEEIYSSLVYVPCSFIFIANLCTNAILQISILDDFEYEVVAIINNHAGIKSRHDLKGKRYCHPGYGYETDWTRILANVSTGKPH